VKALRAKAEAGALRVLGLMSGTSVDGIDAVVAEIEGEGTGLQVRQIGFVTAAYPEEVRREILEVARGAPRNAEQICRLDHAVGDAFARAGLLALEAGGLTRDQLDLVGSHGQTIFHDPERRITWQIGEPTRIAAALGVPVVADFRRADLAEGGHGAPLVPLFDALVLRSAERGRALLNVGGISNVTVLPAGSGTEGVFAFDTGPGNVLIDEFLRHATHGRLSLDEDGRLAAQGRVDEELLDGFLEHPYFYEKPPKSTGREVFGAGFVALTLGEWGRSGERLEDMVATLTEFTVQSIVGSVREYVLPRAEVHEVLVSGGGVHNGTLLQRLREELAELKVEPLDAVGFSADAKEALAFAVLARETVLGRPGNIPAATGARRPVVLGHVTPGRVA
jgi:anhydro-N-acetylmuramic acid kinase